MSYSDEKESYKLLTINGRRTFLTYGAIGGVITEGEFGSMLNEIFAGRSQTEFRWDHWTTLRKRPTHVYTFRVRRDKSHYRMTTGTRGRNDTAVLGQHGYVYVDGDTGRTVRILAEADGIPADFAVRGASTMLDYDFVEIAGRQYLLPLHAETRLKTLEMLTRNDVEFQSYRKFAADTTITYDPH